MITSQPRSEEVPCPKDADLLPLSHLSLLHNTAPLAQTTGAGALQPDVLFSWRDSVSRCLTLSSPSRCLPLSLLAKL